MNESRAPTRGLHLFQGYGVELEYMIVEESSLEVLPVADVVLAAEAGRVVGEVAVGPLCWSNELALHVIELKTNGPAAALTGLAETFQAGVRAINRHLAEVGGRLLPTAMHPWMDPVRETRLWPHDNSPIYASFDRIFGCRGHGWSNLQSAHLNLPFSGDGEFARLHAAIRLVLPLLPALAASSPVLEGRLSGLLDSRLAVYRKNQQRFPAIAGAIVPEPVFSRGAYQRGILRPMYRAIAPFDPGQVLQHEWLNSRGAIARFERNTIEIRLLDVQECPAADLAIATLVVATLRALSEDRWLPEEAQRQWPVAPLAAILERTIAEGDQAPIDNAEFLAAFGFPSTRARAGEVWQHLATTLLTGEGPVPLQTILRQGPLARRLLRVLGLRPSRRALLEVYRELGHCLQEGRLFHG